MSFYYPNKMGFTPILQHAWKEHETVVLVIPVEQPDVTHYHHQDRADGQAGSNTAVWDVAMPDVDTVLVRSSMDYTSAVAPPVAGHMGCGTQEAHPDIGFAPTWRNCGTHFDILDLVVAQGFFGWQADSKRLSVRHFGCWRGNFGRMRDRRVDYLIARLRD
jgi:hypothetical protein